MILLQLRKLFVLIGFVALVWLSACDTESDPQPIDDDDGPTPIVEEAFAFPGAEGFGNKVTGGRGGRVIFVTNLNDAGAGSFRAAVQTLGARYIIFKVSGNIELNSPVTISQGNITIAGQTAPGDGITIKNHTVVVNADNVIIRFLRFRMGDQGGAEDDALWGRYRKDIIIDHCSMSWSTDECSSFYGNENFTMQWCILSESLRNSVHDKGSHGYGGIWGGKNASFHHNLLAHHDNRNPRFDHPGVYSNETVAANMRGAVDFRNNVVYNWRVDAAYGGEKGSFNMVNNYFRPGPATLNGRRFLNAYKQATQSSPLYGYGEFYISGNFVHGHADITADNWIGVVAKDGTIADKQALQLAAPLPSGTLISSHSATQAYESVLNYAGASLMRDAVDERIMNDVRNISFLSPGSNGSTNGLIDSQEDVGGWPPLNSLPYPIDSDNDGMPDAWEIAMGLNPNATNHNGRDLSTAYDNIEVYINSLVKEIMEKQIE